MKAYGRENCLVPSGDQWQITLVHPIYLQNIPAVFSRPVVSPPAEKPLNHAPQQPGRDRNRFTKSHFDGFQGGNQTKFWIYSTNWCWALMNNRQPKWQQTHHISFQEEDAGTVASHRGCFSRHHSSKRATFISLRQWINTDWVRSVHLHIE